MPYITKTLNVLESLSISKGK